MGGPSKASENLAFPAGAKGFVREEKEDFWRSCLFLLLFLASKKVKAVVIEVFICPFLLRSFANMQKNQKSRLLNKLKVNQ